MRNLRKTVTASRLIFISLLLPLSSADIFAATLYKWVDDDGKVRYSDRMPPTQVKKKHQTLNKQGIVVETKEAAKTIEELAAEAEAQKALEAQQAEEKRKKDAQDKKDRVLLLTFSSEEEMNAVRDNRIDVVDSVISLIQKSIAENEATLIRLQDSADTNYVSKGKEVPGGLAQKIEHFTRKIANRKKQLQVKEAEKQKLNAQFDNDIARYRFLRNQQSN